MSQKVLLNATEVNIALHRLACQLIENHNTFSNTVLIGIQPRGIFLDERIKSLLETEYKVKNIELGYLDITFYRDDFRRRDEPLEATNTQIDFLIENKNVVLICTGLVFVFSNHLLLGEQNVTPCFQFFIFRFPFLQPITTFLFIQL